MIDQKVLESFPPGSNPFHHDAISVGMTLEKIGLPDVYVMDSGKLGQGLYIYNKVTGQRVKITGLAEQLVVKEWVSDEPLPEQMRWKMSFRDDATYMESESNSFLAMIRVMFVAWRRRRKS